MSQTKRPNDQVVDAEVLKKPKVEGSNGHCNGTANGKHAVYTDEQLKEDLAIAHRLCAAYGFDELDWNHFSARQPGWVADDFYVTPGKRMWADMHPQHLVRPKNSTNIAAYVLHTACYTACPDALAVCHIHSPAIEAVSVLEDGLMFLSQSAAPFYERVAYYEWQGLADDLDKELEDIVACFKTSKKPPRALIMRNHGAITTGKTVAEAFVAMYYLNRVCAVQLNVLQTGQKIHYPLKSALEYAAKQFDDNEEFHHGCEWPALKTWINNSERGDVPPVLRSNLS